MFEVEIMENLQHNNNHISNFVSNSYQKLFSEPSLKGIEPQMPLFQLNAFLKRAIQDHYLVTIQINGTEAIYETTGFLTAISEDRFILSSDHQNITYLLQLTNIRFLKRVS
ncbi:hypothetical protein AH70_00195 [Pediococcus damnosus LMG 28219]|uniref:hypothetical protein n=2 Tax=Pediococcus damnosus TaxID=51663 RepID=UPI00061DFEB0|nr:hypothetical protein [Pediococcus damnosus]KJU73662.1 hypothetical protein AH70_00195 [Pediococcus damnosus LMG 28219]PIO81799.1 hypothetical protein BSQ38_09225 [Pediococcus damnosus]PIO84645.1 hypothetical protein BSQ37_01205 [Pediococcus damnosus]PJE48674.1 hypothetical protein BSQ36_01210 [Pediococcus damnosus]GEA92900.1 hypothetical protein PDA01_07930 [Pediococcus damnosus]